ALSMPSRYVQWMYDWETRLTSVDNNRVVRPLEWGVEWARDWPCRNGFAPGYLPAKADSEKFLREYNRRILLLPNAVGFSSGASRSPGLQHSGSTRSKVRSESPRHTL